MGKVTGMSSVRVAALNLWGGMGRGTSVGRSSLTA